MIFDRFRSSSIRVRITAITVLGIVLMCVIAGANKYLDISKSENIEVERQSHAAAKNGLRIIMTEAQYINRPDAELLVQISQLRETLVSVMEEVASDTADKDIRVLSNGIIAREQEHSGVFESVVRNIAVIADAQQDIAAKSGEVNDLLSQIVIDIDQKEAMLLMEGGNALDSAMVGIRNEIKDFLRLNDRIKSNIQGLFLIGDAQNYQNNREEFLAKQKLSVNNIQIMLTALSFEKFFGLWNSVMTLLPEIKALEQIMAGEWKNNQDIMVRLMEIGQDAQDAATEISQLTRKNIRRSARTADIISLIVAIGGICALLALGLIITRSIVKPVLLVVKGLKDIAQGDGDLTIRLSVKDQSEVGELAKWFNVFVEKQHLLVGKIVETATGLAAFTAEVTSTASQLAASAAEETTTVTEVSTTTQQVRQTVALSSEKASSVAEAAEAMSQVSASGQKVTTQAASGMKRIKGEMGRVAQSIVKLSEQTQNIGKIIGAVNELANQSELLSVNASIEAAKAGEFGKGFAVVAHEVKALADQSKQATSQIRQVLKEIHKATSDAVTAAETSVKAVEEGMGFSTKAGEVIKALSDSIQDSVNSATQIASSGRQQLAGMEQLEIAMESIKDASGQNLDSSKRLETLVMDLSDLGKTLESLTNRFKL